MVFQRWHWTMATYSRSLTQLFEHAKSFLLSLTVTRRTYSSLWIVTYNLSFSHGLKFLSIYLEDTGRRQVVLKVIILAVCILLIIYRAFVMPTEEAEYKRFFGPLVEKRGRALPDYRELVYNASLMLSNEHYAMGNVPATPLNFKFVGGFHIEEPVKPLPQVPFFCKSFY